MNDAASSSGHALPQRYRLPRIEREGVAQLSLLETALWPLQGGKLPASLFSTSYEFPGTNTRGTAQVTVFSPLGMQPEDEYVLWGLLGATLDRPGAEPTLLATPYWITKRLKMPLGGTQYDQLRAALERLATVAYQNTGFFNPLTKQHERVTFHFFSCFLPTQGRGGKVASDRVWRIEWDKHFFELCRATGGSLLFDLDVYRQLSPAARRLFLKLKDRFWRASRVHLNVDDLTINGLGYAAARPLKKRKYDLVRCLKELLSLDIIEPGPGQTEPADMFLRRSKGCYVVVLSAGAYFRQVAAERTTRQKQTLTDDPLYQPLRRLGVDAAGIRRVFAEYSRGRIKQWIRVTDTALHEQPHGFPGFKQSPAAFLMDGLQNDRLPPDWLLAHEKRRERLQWEREQQELDAQNHALRLGYEQERAAALQAFVRSPEVQPIWQSYHERFSLLYRATDPSRASTQAESAATTKIERELFQFPEFGVWRLQRLA